MGSLQVGISAGLFFVIFLWGFGFVWQSALAIGLTLARSSTAIVLTYLNEKNKMSTPAGQSAFAVLLFQDIAVIPMLAIFPMLAIVAVDAVNPDNSPTLVEENPHSLMMQQNEFDLLNLYQESNEDVKDPHEVVNGSLDSVTDTHDKTQTQSQTSEAAHPEGSAFSKWLKHQAGWLQALISIGVVLSIVVIAHFVLRYVFRYIAKSGLREMFTVCALFIVIGIAFIMGEIGISAALGTFLAGVVLAESEYRHQLETDIEPFKGLLLGLFFITVGASMDFSYILTQPGYIAGVTALVIGIKMLVLYSIGRVFKLSFTQNKLFFFSLAQAGEFAFVLFSFATANNILTQDQSSPLVLIVALTMMLTPLMLIVYERYFAADNSVQTHRQPDTIEEENNVVVAGFGRMGQIVVRLLHANGYSTTIIEQDADHIEMVKKYDYKAYYGDAANIDLLHSAGLAKAKLFVITIDDKDAVRDIVKAVKSHYPNLKIVARVRGRIEAFELINLGVQNPVRETFSSAVDMAVQSLEVLGFRKHQAYKLGEKFKVVDEKSVKTMAVGYGEDETALVKLAQDARIQLEVLLKREIEENKGTDKDW